MAGLEHGLINAPPETPPFSGPPPEFLSISQAKAGDSTEFQDLFFSVFSPFPCEDMPFALYLHKRKTRD